MSRRLIIVLAVAVCGLSSFAPVTASAGQSVHTTVHTPICGFCTKLDKPSSPRKPPGTGVSFASPGAYNDAGGFIIKNGRRRPIPIWSPLTGIYTAPAYSSSSAR